MLGERILTAVGMVAVLALVLFVLAHLVVRMMHGVK